MACLVKGLDPETLEALSKLRDCSEAFFRLPRATKEANHGFTKYEAHRREGSLVGHVGFSSNSAEGKESLQFAMEGGEGHQQRRRKSGWKI